MITETEQPKIGRPSIMTEEMREAICDAIAEGKTVREICAADDMPAERTIYATLARDEAFVQQYARAKAVQADRMAEELLEISDDASNDWMERNAKEGEESGWTLNGEHVQRSRLRVDSRKWLMSKMAPKKYGEKIQHTGDGGGPLQVAEIRHVIVDPRNPDS